MSRALGETQKGVLRSLSRQGYWYHGCGWLWDTVSGTTKIMESLRKRGLVTKTDYKGPYGVCPRYDLVKEKADG